MINRKKIYRILNIRTIIFIIVLYCVAFYLSDVSLINRIGQASIVILLLCGPLYILQVPQKIKMNKFWLMLLLLTLYNTYLLLNNYSSASLYNYFMQLAIYMYVCAMSSASITEKNVVFLSKNITRLLYLLMVMLSALYFFSAGTHVQAAFTFGVFLCSVFYAKNYFKRCIALIIIFTVCSDRGVAVSVIIFLLVYHALLVFRGKVMLYKLVFIIYAVAIVAIPFMYVDIYTKPYAQELNKMVYEYTDKNFFSGRQTIWPIIISYIEESQTSGYGLGNEVLASEGIRLSTHNLYLYLLLQGGWIQLILFYVFLYFIWCRFYKYLSDRSVRVSATVLLTVLFTANFELTLMANTLSQSVFIWLSIGIGLMRCNDLSKNQ